MPKFTVTYTVISTRTKTVEAASDLEATDKVESWAGMALAANEEFELRGVDQVDALAWTYNEKTYCHHLDGLACRYLIRPHGDLWEALSFSHVYRDATPRVVIQGVSLAEAKYAVEAEER